MTEAFKEAFNSAQKNAEDPPSNVYAVYLLLLRSDGGMMRNAKNVRRSMNRYFSVFPAFPLSVHRQRFSLFLWILLGGRGGVGASSLSSFSQYFIVGGSEGSDGGRTNERNSVSVRPSVGRRVSFSVRLSVGPSVLAR